MLDDLPDDLLRNVIIHTDDKDDVMKIFRLNHRMRVFSREKRLAVMWSEEQDGIVRAFHDALQWVRDEGIARSMIPRMTTTERMVAYVGAPDKRAWRDHLLPGPEHINDLIPCDEGDGRRAHLLHFAHTVEEVEDMLTLQGIDVNVRNSWGFTPLLAAVTMWDIIMWDMSGVAAALAKAPGIDVDKAGPKGVTPLHIAARDGLVSFVGTLLRAGADINAAYGSNITPLYEAAQSRQRRVVDLLVSTEGVAVNAATATGFTALHIAAHRGYPEIVAAVASHPGVELNTRITEQLFAPLHFAVMVGCILTTQVLIAAGADVNVRTAGGITPLCFAVLQNRIDAIKALIEAGADVNMREDAGRAPLHHAVANDNKITLRMLIAAGADVNVRTGRGVTPLCFAVQHNRIGAIKALIEAGADVNARTAVGLSPLHFGVQRMRAHAVQLLIEAGADVNTFTDEGYAPLHVAVGWNQASVVRVLLAAPGANVNIQTADGKKDTPLHIAALKGNAEIVLAILGTRGVDRHMRAADGRDAARVALDYNNDEVATLIQNE
jgi:ankyrin repeat protein